MSRRERKFCSQGNRGTSVNSFSKHGIPMFRTKIRKHICRDPICVAWFSRKRRDIYECFSKPGIPRLRRIRNVISEGPTTCLKTIAIFSICHILCLAVDAWRVMLVACCLDTGQASPQNGSRSRDHGPRQATGPPQSGGGVGVGMLRGAWDSLT